MIDLSLRDRIYQVIFGTDTVAGQRFDIVLIYLILVSVLAVVLDSIAWIHSCLLYTSPSPRDRSLSRMPSSA